MLVQNYGLGGFDPAKPNSNVIEQWDDGTRTYTDYRTTPATVRPYGAAENTGADARAVTVTRTINDTSLRDKAQQAIAANDAFLAVVSPTNAQVVAHVQRLTRENTALIRLVIGALDSTSGT